MTVVEYQERVEQLDRVGLFELWEQVKSREISKTEWPSGMAFEHLVVRTFQLEGVAVRWPYLVTYSKHRWGTMEQIDGIVRIDGITFLLESKDLDEAASIESIAKLRFRLESRPPGTMGVVFSTSDFSLPTEIFAQFAVPLNVLLWGRADIDYALPRGKMKEGLRAKLVYAVEEGLPLRPLGAEP